MTLNAGLRFSYNDFNREFLCSPRVNLSINPMEYGNWYYRIGAGLYYQSPFYKEYRETVTDEFGNASIRLNRDIKSPRSFQFIFGTDFTFRAMNRPFKLTGEIYYKNLANLISYEYDQPENQLLRAERFERIHDGPRPQSYSDSSWRAATLGSVFR